MEDQKRLVAEQPPPYGQYYPPAQNPPPPTVTAQSATATVVTQPVVAVQQHQLRDHPVQVTCPTGGHVVTTNIRYEAGTLTWLVALLLCLFFWPLVFVPFFVNEMKDVVHTCPIDGTVIGVYRRM